MNQREQIIRHWMGREVHVVVDRPVGYRHGDLVYPVNYGFLPGVMAEDGEEQDCYSLGVEEPLEADATEAVEEASEVAEDTMTETEIAEPEEAADAE